METPIYRVAKNIISGNMPKRRASREGCSLPSWPQEARWQSSLPVVMVKVGR
jgi:hypothetical protein